MQGKPITDHMGLEIDDVELQSLTSPESHREFISLVRKHLVVVVRNQKLTMAAFSSIGSWLGEFEPGYPADYRLEDYPEIFTISNLREEGTQIGSTTNGMGWHTDGVYTPAPITFTMLYTVESPRVGGHTLFADMYAAYESLPEKTKERIENLYCVHSYQYQYMRRPNAPPMTDEMKRKFPDIRRPLVKKHSVTGRKGLYLTAGTVVAVEGPDGPIDKCLVNELIEHATSERFVYRHKGEPGDFIIWDNEGTMHSASPYDTQAERRLVYRIMTAGEPAFSRGNETERRARGAEARA
jgi:taurine dioxygenase